MRHAVLHEDDRLGQAIDVLARALEQVEGEALRALGANAGQALELDDTRLEGTRTPIPGQRTLDLDARKYNVFFEARAIPDPDRVGDALDDPEATPLRIRITQSNAELSGRYSVSMNSLPKAGCATSSSGRPSTISA